MIGYVKKYLFISYYSYFAYSYNYRPQKMHLIKHNIWQIIISYIFQHQGAILKKSFR